MVPEYSEIKNSRNKNEYENLLLQLDSRKIRFNIEVEKQTIPLTNLDKKLWPEQDGSKGETKRDFIRYLVKISPYLLPHLKDRPLSLSRYPNGIYGEHFFQKHYFPLPHFVETVSLHPDDDPGQEYLLCNNIATLLWLGQIANLELHSWFSRVRPGHDFKAEIKHNGADYYVNYPDFLIFDIDPYIYSGKEASGEEPELNKLAFSKTCEVALAVKATLDKLSCPSFVKTSGKTGLHVFIPIIRKLDFSGIQSMAETFCRFLQQKYPDIITIDWSVEKRKGKIFLDYNQNVRGKTLASIYSPRPTPEASVSVPLRWDELGKVYPTDFTIATVPERLAKTGDLWVNILEAKIDIEKIFVKMGK